jgi:hypothetical protein
MFIFVNFLAVLSELHAGFPTRLVGCAWIMIAWTVSGKKLNTGHTDLQVICNTADWIEKHGFVEDREDGVIDGVDSDTERPVERADEEVDKDYPIFKWMDTKSTLLSFESLMCVVILKLTISVNKFPRTGKKEVNTLRLFKQYHRWSVKKNQPRRPRSRSRSGSRAGLDTPTISVSSPTAGESTYSPLVVRKRSNSISKKVFRPTERRNSNSDDGTLKSE